MIRVQEDKLCCYHRCLWFECSFDHIRLVFKYEFWKSGQGYLLIHTKVLSIEPEILDSSRSFDLICRLTTIHASFADRLKASVYSFQIILTYCILILNLRLEQSLNVLYYLTISKEMPQWVVFQKLNHLCEFPTQFLILSGKSSRDPLLSIQ